MDTNNINSFYYFGKLPNYSDFIGSSPPVLSKLLDFYGLRLNESSIAIRQETILFCIPVEHYRSFLIGVIWNSEDSFHRQYPFTLYIKATYRHFLGFFPFVLSDIPQLTEAAQNTWTNLLYIAWKSIKVNLTFKQNITYMERNMMQSVSSPMPVVYMIPSLPWYSIKPYFFIKNQIKKALRDFICSYTNSTANSFIADPYSDWFVKESSYLLAFNRESIFGNCIENYLGKKKIR